jgi:dTDP-4-dehydrorhamnose 3,5-epimerase
VKFRETPLSGAYEVEIEPNTDERGFFARTWCAHEFARQGLSSAVAQTSISRNERKGTLRGMHMQLPPSQESKLVRCIRGAIHDVIIDLRPDSASYLRHYSVDLSARLHNALYVPPLMAHGFQTLEDETEVLYQMSDFYAPDLGSGWRWNDAAFGIRWPITDSVTITRRDAAYADFDTEAYVEVLRRASGASIGMATVDGSRQ